MSGRRLRFLISVVALAAAMTSYAASKRSSITIRVDMDDPAALRSLAAALSAAVP